MLDRQFSVYPTGLKFMALYSVYRRAITHINLNGYIYIWANLLWIALSLPLITAPAAWAGLVHFSHTAQTRKRVNLSDFWDGFTANFWRGVVIGLITLCIIIVNVTNLLAYSTETDALTIVFRIVWVSAVLFWLSIQLYFWQILEEMESPTLIGGLRNAALMVIQNPMFTVGIWIGIVVLAILSTVFFPAWMLLTGSSFAILTTTAVLDRLRAAGYENPEHQHPFEELTEA